MNVGAAIIFQNPLDARPDHEVYRDDLRLGEQVEPLGFDSIWGVEHHFTDYTMCPDVLQFLTWFAARTKKIEVGSMVVVLPWHDPIRVAEQVSVLDHMSEGRFVLGIGRGLGRVEFEGFRVPMSESRDRFVEAAKMILEGLESGSCELDGKYFQQPKRDIRPRPFKSFKGRTYAAAVSPESSRIMAELGIGILIIPQKPWESVAEELKQYRAIYREVNGGNPPPTIAAGWTFVDENADRAREMAEKYIVGYWRTVLRHYEIQNDHFKSMKGYEYYSKMSEMAQQNDGKDIAEFFMNLQVWGTPEQCYDKIVDIRNRVGADTFVGVFNYAGMPSEEADRNMKLFARKVMPELKKLPSVTEQASAAA